MVESQLPVRAEGWWRRWCRRYIRSLQENRTSARTPSGTAAELSWTDEYGAHIVVRGVCVDRSEGGVGLLSPTPVPDQVLLDVKLQPDIFPKSTRLRHCQRFRDAWLLGVEFIR